MSKQEKLSEWDYVLKLTEKELHSVQIIHDAADFDSHNSLIIFKILLDDVYGDGVRFYGDTKLECLIRAWNHYNLTKDVPAKIEVD